MRTLYMISKTFFGQVSNGNLLIPGHITSFALSTPLPNIKLVYQIAVLIYCYLKGHNYRKGPKINQEFLIIDTILNSLHVSKNYKSV